MRSITGYGKTIAFMLTVMLPTPSLAAGADLGHRHRPLPVQPSEVTKLFHGCPTFRPSRVMNRCALPPAMSAGVPVCLLSEQRREASPPCP